MGGEQQRRLQGAWEKERNGLLSSLKGCEQVATPSALQPQHHNSGAHKQMWLHTDGVLLIYCLLFYHDWMNKLMFSFWLFLAASASQVSPLMPLHPLSLSSSLFHAMHTFLSGFTFISSNTWCPSDVLVPDPNLNIISASSSSVILSTTVSKDHRARHRLLCFLSSPQIL